MIKIYKPEEINQRIKNDEAIYGTTAKVFELDGNEVYKEYLSLIPLLAKFSGGLYLEHLVNLATINAKSFAKIKGVVLTNFSIMGLVLDKACGTLLINQNISLKELLPFDTQIRSDILSISSEFAMHDINNGSIFFSRERGFTLVDLESYSKSDDIDNSYNNLYMFYRRLLRILKYHNSIENEIFNMFGNGVDFCRMEVIYEVVKKYCKKYNLEERELRLERVKK